MELTLQQFVEMFGGYIGVALFAAVNVLLIWRSKTNAESAVENARAEAEQRAAVQHAENTRAIRDAFQNERADRQKLQTRLDELETQFDQRTAEHAAERVKLQSCVTNLQKELLETKEQLEATRSRVAALTEQLDKVRTERLAEAKTLEAARVRNDSLERKLTDTEARLTETKHALDEANVRITEQERRILELEARDKVFGDLLSRLHVVAVEPQVIESKSEEAA